MRMYKSSRVARHHPPYRGKDVAPPPPTFQFVKGYPEDCRCRNHIAIVGEGPGFDEDQVGYPFVGRSGEELDRFLDTYGIEPDDCFITNIGRIYKYGNADPTREDIETWEAVLQEELNIARPIWIAALGRISTRYFIGDVDMDAVHGIPFLVTLPWLDNGRSGRVVVIPIVHPAAGFHSADTQAVIAYDFAQLAATVEGKLTPRDPETADKYPNPEYKDLTDDDVRFINQSLNIGSRSNPAAVAIDTEGLPGNPWGLSYATEPGKAYVIRNVHKVATGVFHRALLQGINEGRLHVVLHNSLHDLRVLREMGIPIPDGSFTDTMVLSYHLCIEPQGLKALAFRHCGMVMDSYEEIVGPAQDRIAVEYYETIEALTAEGIIYEKPPKTLYLLSYKPYRDVEVKITKETKKGLKITIKTKREWLPSQTDVFEDPEDLDACISMIASEGFKLGQCRTRELPGDTPISIGPFKYIAPYTVRVRNKETGELEEKNKRVQQVDRRVAKALRELREGSITAAQLRERWEGTDELVVSTVEEVIGEMREAGLDDVPLQRAINYSARDADATIRIYPILKQRHYAMALERVGDIDHSIIPMVDKMQEVGFPVNVTYFRWLSSDLERRMLEVQQQIKDQYGVWINPNSGDQVADLLFASVEEGGYGLEPTKYTKGRVDAATGQIVGKRGSTIDKVLEGMRSEHPIIGLIMDYRGYNKAKTSFVDVALRRAVFHPEDGTYRVHCKFRITRVSSGRLSATGPNLMAVMGGKLGNEVRDGYVAGDGWELSEWDLSQVEMRVMAHESGDEFLIDMIVADEDIHSGTAAKMFGLDIPRPYTKKSVPKEQRDPAKRTGFGVITGIQAPGLVDQMRLQGIIVSEDEAAMWIETWLAACPRVPEYMHACHREAMAYGFVRDWAGRIRYLPGIHSPFKHVRQEAGRQSHSHKIQGGAQEIMKIAMSKVWREVIPYWLERGKEIMPILQIHDALMLRHRGFNAEEKAELDAQIRACMYSAAPAGYKVPLDAGYNNATTWGKLDH